MAATESLSHHVYLSPVSETLDHGGFVSQAALLAEIENLAAVGRDAFVSRPLLDGLKEIAERAPSPARAVVPVHADSSSPGVPGGAIPGYAGSATAEGAAVAPGS